MKTLNKVHVAPVTQLYENGVVYCPYSRMHKQYGRAIFAAAWSTSIHFLSQALEAGMINESSVEQEL
jgi:hypothetical protein